VLDQALQLIDSPPLNPTPIPEPSGVITDTSVISETLEGDSP
jgi:hypothetical protein